jgi:hypothetical protein
MRGVVVSRLLAPLIAARFHEAEDDGRFDGDGSDGEADDDPGFSIFISFGWKHISSSRRQTTRLHNPRNL